MILRHTSAPKVEHAQIGLRRDVPQFGRLPVPARRLAVILRHAPALIVQQAQIVLRGRVSLFGRLPKPARRLPVILRYPLTPLVGHAKIELRVREALLGRLAPPAGRLAMILRHTPAQKVQQAEIELRIRVAFFGERPKLARGARIVAATVGRGGLLHPGPRPLGPGERREQEEGQEKACGSEHGGTPGTHPTAGFEASTAPPGDQAPEAS